MDSHVPGDHHAGLSSSDWKARYSPGETAGRASFIALNPPSSATVTSATTPLKPSRATSRLPLRIPSTRSAQAHQADRPEGDRQIATSRPRRESSAGAATQPRLRRGSDRPARYCGRERTPCRSGRSCPGRRRTGCVAGTSSISGLSREIQLVRNRQEAVLEETAEGLLGLPHVAHLEAHSRSGPLRAAHRRQRDSSRARASP